LSSEPRPAARRARDTRLRRAFEQRELLIAEAEAFLSRFDAWIGPVLPVVAYPIPGPSTSPRT
jgi:hypothetical protein